MVSAVPPLRGDKLIPIILGGGPAGSAAAITLGQSGHRPILIERTSGPIDKVCGDFLSADTIQRCRELGVDPAALGGVPIGRVRLLHGDRVAEAQLPFAAMGLSRRLLDAALLQQAASAGADLRTGHAVQLLSRDVNKWIVRFARQPALCANTVFLATGKHDLRGLPRPKADQGAVGMKMYFTLPPKKAQILDGITELALFPGGYAGLQPVEGGQVVLCVAAQRSAFRRAGGNWAGLLRLLTKTAPNWASLLTDATPRLSRPLAVAAVPYGFLAVPHPSDDLFRLGDQAAVIPSLTGDGMAIALYSGELAVRVWLDGGNASTYHRQLARELGTQMRLSRLLHRACMASSVQAAIIASAGLFPDLVRLAAKRTRIASASMSLRSWRQLD